MVLSWQPCFAVAVCGSGSVAAGAPENPRACAAGASPPSPAPHLAGRGRAAAHAALHRAGLAGVPQGARPGSGAGQAMEALEGRQLLAAVRATPSCGCRGSSPQPRRRCGCWRCRSQGGAGSASPVRCCACHRRSWRGCWRGRCPRPLRDGQKVARLQPQRGDASRGVSGEGERARREAGAHLCRGVGQQEQMRCEWGALSAATPGSTHQPAPIACLLQRGRHAR